MEKCRGTEGCCQKTYPNSHFCPEHCGDVSHNHCQIINYGNKDEVCKTSFMCSSCCGDPHSEFNHCIMKNCKEAPICWSKNFCMEHCLEKNHGRCISCNCSDEEEICLECNYCETFTNQILEIKMPFQM